MPGQICKILAPQAGNPRNSEGAFLTLKDGRILFVFSRYCGESCQDHASADLAKMVSNDEGMHFSDPCIVIRCTDVGAQNLMSVSLLRMQDGAVGLFYLYRTNDQKLQMMLARSYDEGETFTEPVLCMHSEEYYVVNNDRVLRLQDGRIIIPAALHPRKSIPCADGTIKHSHDGRSQMVLFVSEDDGQSFAPLGPSVGLSDLTHTASGLQEPGLIELQNGTLWAFMRTDLGRHYEAFSFDGGHSFTSPRPSRFTGPCSPLCIKRLPSGKLLAVWNPIPIWNGRSEFVDGAWLGGRSPLVMAVSSDEGQTFTEPVILEDDPRAGFCYTAIHCTDKGVLLAYCGGTAEDRSCLNRLIVRFIPFDNLPI